MDTREKCLDEIERLLRIYADWVRGGGGVRSRGAEGFYRELLNLALAQGVKPLVLWGLGGMGKTELARRFGRQYARGRAHFVTFRGSFYDTVADGVAFGIPGIREQELRPEQRWALAMATLGQCPPEDLLIIDNADADGGTFADLKDDTYLAAAYNNLGSCYGELGDHGKALEYSLKALGIWEHVLPADHPNLALSYNNVAWTYYDLGQLDQAAAHMRRAADIINRSALPKDHEDRVDYNRWAERLEREVQ